MTPKGPKLSPEANTVILMAVSICFFGILLLLLKPAAEMIHRALLVGLILTMTNFLLAVIALKLKLWTVRGAWPVFGYPLSMIAAWLFLIATYCLVLSQLHSWGARFLVAALAGMGGPLWDLTIHRRAAILVLDRAKPWQPMIYWLVLSLLGMILFFSI